MRPALSLAWQDAGFSVHATEPGLPDDTERQEHLMGYITHAPIPASCQDLVWHCGLYANRMLGAREESVIQAPVRAIRVGDGDREGQHAPGAVPLAHDEQDRTARAVWIAPTLESRLFSMPLRDLPLKPAYPSDPWTISIEGNFP